jgi:tRNA(Arg) A34 adenosine deaminase TadA
MISEDPMQLAFDAALGAFMSDEVPVGAVVTNSLTGEILGQAGNRVKADCDPSAHAEILVLRTACQARGHPQLPDCDLYVTLEPCAMCATAISHARIRRVIFAAYDPKGGGIEHGARVYEHSTCHHKPEVIGGIREAEAAALLKRFFQNRRQIVSD